MNIIIPMAGMGKRMRPHTLTTAKPLIPVAGKAIVQRLVAVSYTHLDGSNGQQHQHRSGEPTI